MITSIIPKLPFINKKDTLDFYQDNLGFSVLADYGDYLLLQKDVIELHFFAYPTLNPKKSDFMIYLRVDQNIDDFYESCKSFAPQGKAYQLESKAWGQIEFSLIDPNGTLLTFGQCVGK